MQAAAQDELNADGYFPATGAGAYPLTFVEYAVVPKAPLLDDSCRTRAQQSMLTAFLTYVTGPGQATLAPGLVPLTQDLAAEAAAAIAKIGKGTPTGACAPRPTATPNPTTATTTTRARSEVAARSNSSTGLPNVAGPTVAPLPAAGQATAPAAAASDTTALPSARPVAAFKATTFTGAAPTSTTTVAIGLVLLAAILAAAAYLASIGKSPLDLLAMIRRGRR